VGTQRDYFVRPPGTRRLRERRKRSRRTTPPLDGELLPGDYFCKTAIRAHGPGRAGCRTGGSTFTPGVVRTGALPEESDGDVSLYLAEIAAGPRVRVGPVFASLVAGGRVLRASGHKGETVAVISTDLDLNCAVHSRVRVGLGVGGLVNPKSLSKPEDEAPKAMAPGFLVRIAGDVRSRF
jgi:hypothetical protein